LTLFGNSFKPLNKQSKIQNHEKKIIIIGSVIVGCRCCAVSGQAFQQEEKRDNLETVKVERGSITNTVTATVLSKPHSVDVGTQVSVSSTKYLWILTTELSRVKCWP
jgi:hypothetical protein